MAQEQSKHGQQSEEPEETPTPAPNPEVQERHNKLAGDVDSLLDDIDDVLEEDAEEFVRAYIQQGGQ